MALSANRRRSLKRLRVDANQLWREQRSLFGRARELAGRGISEARAYNESEIMPVIRKNVDENIRPAFDRGVEQGRRVLAGVSDQVQKHVIPAVAQAGGNVTGAVRELVDQNPRLQEVATQVNDKVKDVAEQAKGLGKRAARKLAKAQKLAQKQAQKQAAKQRKSGVGIGGWFLIGAGVAAVAAVSYALWQTFRADDDLWVADEELDAPVTSVTNE